MNKRKSTFENKQENSSRKKMAKANVEKQLAFGKKNFVFLIIGVVLLALGFTLMATENFIDANEFSLALYIAPPLLFAGFGIIAYAILLKPETIASPEEQSEETLA